MSRRHRQSQAFSLFSFQDIISAVTAVIILIALILSIELISRDSAPTEPVTSGVKESVEELQQQIDAMVARQKALQKRVRVLQADNASISTISAKKLREEIEKLAKEVKSLQRQLERLKDEFADARRGQQDSREQDMDTEAELEKIEELEEELAELREELDELKDKNVVVYNRSGLSGKRAWLVDLSDRRIQAAAIGGSEPVIFTSSFLAARESKFLSWAKQLDRGTNYLLLLFRPSAAEVHGPFPDIVKKLQGMGFPVGMDLIEEDQTIRFGNN